MAADMWVLELLGTLSLRNETHPVPVAAQQRRSSGLLAVLALSGRQGCPRDRIESYLWPESSASLARHSLDQTVYAVRHALGADVVLASGRELRLNPALVRVDLWSFEDAIRDRRWTDAVALYRGMLLDGFHFGDSRDFEAWLDGERARLRRDYQTAVECLAVAAAESGDHARSATWWRTLANSEPLSASTTKHLMLELSAAGDRAGAVKHARLYQQLVRQELEIEPDAEIDRLAAAFSRPAVGEVPAAAVAKDHVAGVAHAPDAALIGTAERSGPAPRRSRRRRAAFVAVMGMLLLLVVATVRGWMRPAISTPVVRYTQAIDSSEAMVPGTPWSGRLALSPDGSRLAYVGGPRSLLLIRPRNQLHAVAVPGTEGAETPFFSPDGRRVGFLREHNVRIASLAGGPPIIVTDSLTGVAGASWGPDDAIYVDGFGPVGLVRVAASAGAVPTWFTRLDSARGEVDHLWPDVLPNGKGVVFTIRFVGRDGTKDRTSYAIAVADIPSGRHRVIVNDAMYARYSASGHLLYVTVNKTLMVAPFDQRTMRLTAEAAALADGIRLGLLGAADVAVSAAGTLIYAIGAGEGEQELVWVNRDGSAQVVDKAWPGAYIGFPAISPDGKRLAVGRVENAAGQPVVDVWVKQLDGGSSMNLTVARHDSYGPAWTADGRSVTYSSAPESGAVALWTKRADGGAPATLQVRDRRGLYNAGWSPDGRWLVFQTDIRSPGNGDILAIRPGIDSAPVSIVATAFTETSPAISPSGRWLAYTSNESGQPEVYVVPFPDARAAKWAISSSGGTEPRWSHRGTELFYRDRAGSLVAVEVHANPVLSVGHTTALFPASQYKAYQISPQYAVGQDDRRFLMIRPAEKMMVDKLVVVENWFEELRARSWK